MNQLVIGLIGLLIGSFAHAETIELTKENSVVLRGEVDAMSVAKVQAELFKKAEAGNDLYLVLDTPGGSVDAGNSLIDSVKGMKVKVHTVTLFAASMGFQIVQNFGDRLVTRSGVLMSHRASGGVQGHMPGEINTRMSFYMDDLERLDLAAAKRMKMPLKAYQSLIRDEYWTQGRKAVKERAADRVVDVRCGSDMTGTTDETIYTFFGPVKVTMSECPLIQGPLAVSLEQAEDKQKAQHYVDMLFNDKRGFIREYVK